MSKELKYMNESICEMDDEMMKEWYDYLTDGNYHSFYEYPESEQFEIWEYFETRVMRKILECRRVVCNMNESICEMDDEMMKE
jgi:translation elongation factor EF-G